MTADHAYRVGDLVQTFFDDGRGGTYCYGVVTCAGPKRVGVTWESGRRQSLHKDRWHLVERTPDRAREEALRATKRVRNELLGKLTAKTEEQLRRRGELRAYAIEPGGTVRLVKEKP